jgi:hypothetical protein
MTTQTDTSHNQTVAELIQARQTELGLSDSELSAQIGFDRTIVITMIKSGTMRLPITKVPALAAALALDAKDVLRQVMAETDPALWTLIQEVLNPIALSTSEVNLVKHLRRLAGDADAVPIVFEGRGVIALVAA